MYPETCEQLIVFSNQISSQKIRNGKSAVFAEKHILYYLFCDQLQNNKTVIFNNIILLIFIYLHMFYRFAENKLSMRAD